MGPLEPALGRRRGDALLVHHSGETAVVTALLLPTSASRSGLKISGSLNDDTAIVPGLRDQLAVVAPLGPSAVFLPLAKALHGAWGAVGVPVAEFAFLLVVDVLSDAALLAVVKPFAPGTLLAIILAAHLQPLLAVGMP